ncbi:hypothetical protein BBR47_11150 [Brevibacillus brevis NBRC 100599]|uniref:Uncharacterized protein n=1 Tax=Brevibacillus brevis (strain 47 / JCM 6285 / NBRC 100599) TaxID=358681 RepID=C0Z6D5_BREBN|nr:hypothetical protein BBR47_11150 [Brevibacillus brevis NBRC 100599]
MKNKSPLGKLAVAHFAFFRKGISFGVLAKNVVKNIFLLTKLYWKYILFMDLIMRIVIKFFYI